MYKKEEIIDQILHGDCFDIMAKIPDNFFDMTFSDPPFNLNKNYRSYKDNMSDSDYLDWSLKWIHHMVRITKPAETIFIHHIPKWLIIYGQSLNHIADFRNWISWDTISRVSLDRTLLPFHHGILYYTKKNFINKDYKFYDLRIPYKKCNNCNIFLNDYSAKKEKIHPFGVLLSDIWTDIYRPNYKSSRVDNPHQLPLSLLERLILMVTDEEDIIFDPFMGIGTTAVAARRLGRRFTGIEIDKKYVSIINEKISLIIPSKINNCYVSIDKNKIKTIRDIDSSMLMQYDNIPRKVKSEMEQLIFNIED